MVATVARRFRLKLSLVCRKDVETICKWRQLRTASEWRRGRGLYWRHLSNGNASMSFKQIAPDQRPWTSLFPGLYLGLAALALFVLMAYSVATGGAACRFDLPVAQALHDGASAGMTTLMRSLSDVHDTFGILLACACLGAWLAWRGNSAWLLRLLVCVPGGMGVNWLVKQLIERHRPVFDVPLLNLSSYSFPSGHTSSATLLYGLICAYCWRHASGALVRVVPLAVAVPMVLAVAFSRLYLGVHYLSDVLGACLEALAWLALCLTGAQWRERSLA